MVRIVAGRWNNVELGLDYRECDFVGEIFGALESMCW